MNKLQIPAIAGITAPIVAYICILSAIASSPQFSWTNNALSDLGIQQGITAPIFNSGLVISGLLFIIFSMGLFFFSNKNAVGKLGATLLILTAIMLICIGIFNENYRPIHYYVSVAFFLLMPLSLLVMTASYWLEGKRRLSILTFTVASIAATVWILQFILHYVPAVAIPELASGLAASAWVIILSFNMLKSKT